MNRTNENNQKEKTGKRQEMNGGDTWFLEKKGTRHKVHNSDIVYVKSNDNYCQIHTKGELVFTIRMTMKNIQELLPEKLFIRVHRQYLVQLDMIDSINFQDGVIRLGENEIPVSRRRRKELGSKVIQPRRC